MSDLGGVTVQQLLRKRYGLIVRHIVSDGKYYTEVLKEGVIIYRSSDDCLATASFLLTQKLWRFIYKGTVRYAYSQCYTYLQGKCIETALENFNEVEFERGLLPVLQHQDSLKEQIALYERVKTRREDGDVYMLYDVLVRLFVYAREHNIVVERAGIDGLDVVSHLEGLTNKDAECVDVTEAGAYLAALEHIHAGATMTTVGERVYLVKNIGVSAFASVNGEPHSPPTAAQLEDIVSQQEPKAVCEARYGPVGVVDVSVRERYTELVARILGQNGNPTCSEEDEVYNYHRTLVLDKRVGKNALVGLGNVAGEGELGSCLERVFQEVRKRVRGNLSSEESYILAASKLSGMNSAKIIIRRGNALHLENRVLSENRGPALIV